MACSVLYIYVCWRVRTSVQEKDSTQLEKERRNWLYAVGLAFCLQLLFGIFFGYWVTVLVSFCFFGCCAYAFYAVIESHEQKIADMDAFIEKYSA